MGAPTSNRKRGGYSFSLSSFSPLSSPLDSDVHLSKKPKLSPMPLNPEAPKSSVSSSSASLQSTFSRVQAYPKPTEPIRRVIHAPCRNFSFSSRMGNALYRKLGDAKKLAIDTFHTPRKDKYVIDLEEEGNKDVISDDSIAEEINRSDRRRSSERRSVGLAQILDTTTTDDIYLKEKYEHFAAIRRQGSSSVISDLSNQTPLSNRTPKPDDCGKRLESLSLSLEVEEVSEPPHKRLYKDAEKRNSKLRHLSFLIEFTTKKLPFFRRTPKKPEKDLYGDLFVPLTDEEEAEVSRALSNSHRHKLLVTHHDSNIEITGEVLQCLRPGAWLNDEVINLYLELLKEREKREPERFLKCHFFNTFFYKKVISGKGGYDYKAVRRWTTPRKIGYALIDCDKIFVPIHKEIHWCLAIINKKDETFQYLDSLKGRDLKVLEVLARYYVDEVKDKSAKDIDVSSWKREYVHDLPAQENGSDCGMFMIKYADFYSRGLGLNFQQGHMPYFRKRTAHEILKLKAL